MPYAPSALPPPPQLQAVLSAPRFAAYIGARGGNQVKATQLYGWNACASAALLLPMHFAEITARNIVDDALTQVYGSDWPWHAAFRFSLPNPPQGYSPKQDLRRNAGAFKQRPTGQVVTRLAFVFWQMLFTSTYHQRIWQGRLAVLLPYAQVAPGTPAEEVLRRRVYADLEAIRKLRNRVAHHEPIHTRPDLAGDLSRMLDLIDLRCIATGRWVRNMEDVSALLPLMP